MSFVVSNFQSKNLEFRLMMSNIESTFLAGVSNGRCSDGVYVR